MALLKNSSWHSRKSTTKFIKYHLAQKIQSHLIQVNLSQVFMCTDKVAFSINIWLHNKWQLALLRIQFVVQTNLSQVFMCIGKVVFSTHVLLHMKYLLALLQNHNNIHPWHKLVLLGSSNTATMFHLLFWGTCNSPLLSWRDTPNSKYGFSGCTSCQRSGSFQCKTCQEHQQCIRSLQRKRGSAKSYYWNMSDTNDVGSKYLIRLAQNHQTYVCKNIFQEISLCCCNSSVTPLRKLQCSLK